MAPDPEELEEPLELELLPLDLLLDPLDLDPLLLEELAQMAALAMKSNKIVLAKKRYEGQL